MILVVRGTIWYGLYFFLILLPLATAAIANPIRVSQPLMVEIAVEAGVIGFALISLEFALISRIETAAEPFGEDPFQLFHTLVLNPVDHQGLSFLPVRFAWLKGGRTPFGVGQHPISLSSLADVGPCGSISFTIKNLGDWSGEQVSSWKTGEQVWVHGPHGVCFIKLNMIFVPVLSSAGEG
jgi:predicted ferric reductase